MILIKVNQYLTIGTRFFFSFQNLFYIYQSKSWLSIYIGIGFSCTFNFKIQFQLLCKYINQASTRMWFEIGLIVRRMVDNSTKWYSFQSYHHILLSSHLFGSTNVSQYCNSNGIFKQWRHIIYIYIILLLFWFTHWQNRMLKATGGNYKQQI